MCYVRNQWYDISCATLYVHPYMGHAQLSPFVSLGQVIVCDKCIMLNRRCSSAVLSQIMPHEMDVAANFVKKNTRFVPYKKNRLWKSGRFSKHRFSVQWNSTIWNIKREKTALKFLALCLFDVECQKPQLTGEGGLLKLEPYTIIAVWILFPPDFEGRISNY